MEMLYTQEILKLAAGLKAEPLPNPDITITKHSRICGSTITINLNVKDGQVVAFGATVKACALGQAATAIVEKNIRGKRWEDLELVYLALQNLLEGNDVTFPKEWKDLEVFSKATQHKARHSAILLPFKALEAALKNLP